MAESRHRTTIQVDVDDRAVRSLGQELERAIDPAHMQAFERAVERSNRAIERLTRATERMARASQTMARAQMAVGGGGGGGGGGPGFVNRTASTAIGTRLGMGGGRRGGLQQMARVAGGPAGGEGFLSGAFDMLPYVGPVLGAAIRGGQQYYSQFAALQQGRLASFGRSGLTTGSEQTVGDLMSLGYGPSQHAGQLANIAQMSGRRGAGLDEIAGTASMIERFTGANPAALFGAAEIQGPIDRPERFMSEAMGSLRQGSGIGFRDAELTEGISSLTGALRDLQVSGIMVDPRSLLGLYRGLGAATIGGGPVPGLQGQAGAAFANNIISQGRNVGSGSGPMDFLRLQASGYGRGRSLMQARVFAENNPGEVFFNLMDELRSRTGEGEEQALAFTLAEQMGISSSLASQLAVMDPTAIENMRSASANMDTDQFTAWLGNNMQDASGPLGTAVTEGSMEAQRLQIGSDSARAAVQIHQAELQLVSQFMPAALSLVTGTMDMAQKLVNAVKSGGLPGLMAALAELMPSFAEVGEAATTAATGAMTSVATSVLGSDHPMTQAAQRIENIANPNTDADGEPLTDQRGLGPPPGTTAAPAAEGSTDGSGPLSRLESHLLGGAAEIRRYRIERNRLSDGEMETV